MTLCLMISAQRHQHTVVVWFLFQDAVIHLQGFFHLTIHHHRLSIEGEVVQVVRVFVCKRLDFSDCTFLISLTCIEFTLRHRDALILTIDSLNAIQNFYGLVITVFLLIELKQHLKQIQPFLVALIDLLNHRDSLSEVLLTDIDLRQRFHIGHVVWLKSSSLLEACHRLLCILQGAVILGKEIINLGGFGIQFLTMAQQVKCCCVIAFLSLHHRLEEELIVGSFARLSKSGE